MATILVKSGVQQLALFRGQGFPAYEAYLRGDEELDDLLKTEMKLVCIHMPHHVETSSGKMPVDFCDEGLAGTASFHKLQDLAYFAQQQDVKYIVVHAGFFDSFTQDRDTILDRLALRFQSLDLGKVKVCLENVPCWTNICFEREPIISTEEHLLYFQKKYPQIGVTFDVDHLAINTVFQQYYDSFKTRYLLERKHPWFNLDKFKQQMEQEMMDSTQRQQKFFSDLVSNKIKQFLATLKPDTIHAVGSDFTNYRLVGQLPLVGEALPLGFQGKIKGYDVKDRIDHHSWIHSIPPTTVITLELMLRPEYDYVDQIRQNYEFLTSALL